MRRLIGVFGWVLLTVGVALILLGIASWPPEGLFFAAPYFFGFPGILFTLVGATLVWFGRRSTRADRNPRAHS